MSTIDVQVSQTIQTVTIQRPEVLNALNQQAYDELAAAFRAAADPSIRAVILTATGRSFCSGHDLSGSDSDDPAVDLRWVDATMRAIRGLEKPVITAINGLAVGGGMSLALAGDIRLMARSAKLIPGFIDVGLVPDMGSSWLLAHALGYNRALEWICSGKALDADTALSWGLVSAVVGDEELLGHAQQRAEELAQRPTLAIGLTKQLLSRALSSSFEDAVELEARLQVLAGKSTDYQEGLAAFREKRKPRFTGR